MSEAPGQTGPRGRWRRQSAREPAAQARRPLGISLRRAILIHLRRPARRSPDGVATASAASRTGVLQQLYALEAAGLVSHAAEKHGVGRPRHVYDVTPDAQGLFPDRLRRLRLRAGQGDRGRRR